jgi:hypothetical protein
VVRTIYIEQGVSNAINTYAAARRVSITEAINSLLRAGIAVEVNRIAQERATVEADRHQRQVDADGGPAA